MKSPGGAAVVVLILAAGSGLAWWGGVRSGRAAEHRKAYQVEQRARVDSIRVAQLVKDSTARELREQTRRRDSAAAAQRTKRQAFAVVSDTQVVVVGDTTTYTLPAPLITYIRGADAKLAIDSTWLAKVAADTAAIALERDLWQRRALAAEAQLERERPRFGVKTGISIGTTLTLVLVKLLR